jgi:hypothetical protein
MAYKFQTGAAALSGALVQSGELDVRDGRGGSAGGDDPGRRLVSASNAGDFDIAQHNGSVGLRLSGTLVTATAAELNYVDLTAGTAAASKAIVADASANVDASALTWTDLGAVTTCDINGGAIDGATIGAANATTVKGTTVTATTSLTSSQGITGSSLQLGVYGMTNEGKFKIASFAANWTNAGITVADLGTITTCDINGGAIDGATIGAANATTVKGTTVTATTSLTSSQGITGSSLLIGGYGLTNDGKFAIASYNANWTNAGITVADLGTITTCDINGGAIDGATIGANSAAAGTFAGVVCTTLSATGDVDLGDGTGDTITATGRFDSALVPSSDSARDLGTSALRWSTIYVDSIVGASTVLDTENYGAAPYGTTISASTDFALITSGGVRPGSGGAIYTLPTPSAGKTVHVKLSGSQANVTLSPSTGTRIEALDMNASVELKSTGSAITVVGMDSVTWWII